MEGQRLLCFQQYETQVDNSIGSQVVGGAIIPTMGHDCAKPVHEKPEN